MTGITIRTALRMVCLVAATTAFAGCSSGPQSSTVDGLTFMVHDSWIAEEPSSAMRRAQFVLPGDPGDANVIVYYFGEGTAGSIEANMARWAGQIEGGDPAYGHRIVNGMTVNTIDVSGRYVAAITPGSDERYDEPGWLLRAAIIETDDGPYYIKAVGPEATMIDQAHNIDAFIDSVVWNGSAAPKSGAAHP